MTDAARTAVLNLLRTIPAPKSTTAEAARARAKPSGAGDLVTAGMVSHAAVDDGVAKIVLELPKETAAASSDQLAGLVEEKVAALPGIDTARVVVTAHDDAPSSKSAGTDAAPKGVRLQSSSQNKPRGRAPQSRGASGRPGPASPISLPGVKAIVAVASGKGGVGKSTVAVNLALALSRLGKRTGLLDADIYGPSIPRMLGITGSPDQAEDGEKKLKPMTAYGLSVMSIGLLVDPDTPMIWRGPMVMSAISQMLGDVDWGDLDILIVDMPPGTGDAQLTMAQRVPLSGSVIVSTPQEIALIDARKGIAMFEKTQVPILGVVENMAWFTPPGSNERLYLFGEGGARRTARELGCPFLGEVPLYPALREGSDAGRPVLAETPDGDEARPFLVMAEALLANLSQAGRKPPRIIIEE